MTAGRVARLLPVAVALALVALMTSTAPDWEADPPRDWTRLEIGERGELRDLALTVRTVDVTTSIILRDAPLSTDGAFVVVGVEADALIDPVAFLSVRLALHSGDRYRPREEWPTSRPPITQAGFTTRGTWVFEVPRSGVAGARLQVANDPREFGGYERVLLVDLDLASGGSIQPGPLRLPEATTRVTG